MLSFCHFISSETFTTAPLFIKTLCSKSKACFHFTKVNMSKSGTLLVIVLISGKYISRV